MTRFRNVPGTIYFQSPEQETNTFELLVNVANGSHEVEYFEDFYIDVCENDVFSLYNRPEVYTIASADRARKRLILTTPVRRAERAERAGQGDQGGGPAGGHLFAGGAVLLPGQRRLREPQVAVRLVPQVHRVRAQGQERTPSRATSSTSTASSRTCARPRTTTERVEVAPEDRFFSYKQYLDGGGELIDKEVMYIIARAMIRNKPDSYCMSWDLQDHRHLGDGARPDGPVRPLRREPLGPRRLPALGFLAARAARWLNARTLGLRVAPTGSRVTPAAGRPHLPGIRGESGDCCGRGRRSDGTA